MIIFWLISRELEFISRSTFFFLFKTSYISHRSGFSFSYTNQHTYGKPDSNTRCHRSPLSSLGPLTLHLTIPTDFPHANAVDESPSFFSSSLPSFPVVLFLSASFIPFSISFFFPFYSCLGFNVGFAMRKGRCISCSDR